jgi:hypothetical protein
MSSKPESTEPQLVQIAVSKNGIPVVFDPLHSHAATHLEDTPGLANLVREVISDMNLTGQIVASHFDMGRAVGTCDVVITDSSDEIVYGLRKNRVEDGLVPFTKSRKGEQSNYIALQIVPENNQRYILTSAWIGTFDDDEPFPLAENANERSRKYWNEHAFVYGSQEIIEGSETVTRPW